MSKRFRILLVLVLLGIAVSFLYPSFKWYFLVSQEQKELSAGSRLQIKLYAEQQARDALQELVALGEDDSLPGEYAFLSAGAKERYKLEKKPAPKVWTVREILSSYTGAGELQADLEEHFRAEILALKELKDRTIQLGLDLRGGMVVRLRADIESLESESGTALSAEEQEDAVRRALEILNNRIDQFGVTEPQIRRQGENMIVVELPGDADPERMRKFIQGKGRLNFHIVDTDALELFKEYQIQHPGEIMNLDGSINQPDILPKGTVLRGVFDKDLYGMEQQRGFTVLNETAGLSGNYIRDARVSEDPITNKPLVNFLLTSEGGEIFYKLTSENVNNILAVVLDDKVKAQARINEPIRDAVQVTGFDRDEAAELALVLRTGALPVPLEIINQQAIGASLGEDAIRMGLNAILYGFALVVIFMLLYYKGAGLVANLALVLNLYFMVAILSVFNFTLTLPSIAGVILTVGMAVDANVIIFERIKEEYRTGKSAKAAVKAGFGKAFWTVLDANITTFIAAIALSQLGKGPIQGFAVTLSIGVVSSMFTALFVSRLIFDFATDVLRVKKLSISWRRQAR
jgi:preprotein translocase subunit SecD